MSTKLQNIARIENWMLYHLKGMDGSVYFNIYRLTQLKNTNLRKEKEEIEALRNNLEAIRSHIYFAMCNIKNLQNFRKEKK
jgi:hypothetical protein